MPTGKNANSRAASKRSRREGNKLTPTISIIRIHEPEEASSTVMAVMEQHRQDIRHRAWSYFEQRGQTPGNDWDDWLRAEREILWIPHAEMFEIACTIVLRIAVPGFLPKSLEIMVTPQSLLLQATETHNHGRLEVRLHFCEFGQRLFRRFDLPSPIDVATVSATLDKGILEISADKVRRPALVNS